MRTVAVADELDLNVARALDEALDEHGPVAKSRLGLRQHTSCKTLETGDEKPLEQWGMPRYR